MWLCKCHPENGGDFQGVYYLVEFNNIEKSSHSSYCMFGSYEPIYKIQKPGRLENPGADDSKYEPAG